MVLQHTTSWKSKQRITNDNIQLCGASSILPEYKIRWHPITIYNFSVKYLYKRCLVFVHNYKLTHFSGDELWKNWCVRVNMVNATQWLPLHHLWMANKNKNPRNNKKLMMMGCNSCHVPCPKFPQVCRLTCNRWFSWHNMTSTKPRRSLQVTARSLPAVSTHSKRWSTKG